MADNELTGTGKAVATHKVTFSGDAAQNVQILNPMHVAGAEDAKTVESVTQTVGSAVPPAVVFVGGTDGTNARALKLDASGEAQVDVLTLPALPAGTNVIGQVYGGFATCTTDVTRPADTTAYAINDALSDSTSAPTTGGFTFTSAARVSGGSGIITDAIIATAADAGTLLQGEIWVFDRAVTNINDNAAFAVSDAEIKTVVGVIPFTLEDAGNNGFFHARNLNIGYTCNGSANLRFLVRVKNAYTPVSAEVITCVIKCLYTN